MTQNISQISEQNGKPAVIAVIVVRYDMRGMNNLRPMIQGQKKTSADRPAAKPMPKQATQPVGQQKPQTSGQAQMPNTPGRQLGTNPTANRTMVNKTDTRLTPNKAKDAQRKEQQKQLTPQQLQMLIARQRQYAA